MVPAAASGSADFDELELALTADGTGTRTTGGEEGAALLDPKGTVAGRGACGGGRVEGATSPFPASFDQGPLGSERWSPRTRLSSRTTASSPCDCCSAVKSLARSYQVRVPASLMPLTTA